MEEIEPEIMLHLLCFQALELAEQINTTANLKRSLRTLKYYTYRDVEEFEKTELGSEYQATCIHNFNVMLKACTKDVLLTPIGDFKIKNNEE